MECTGNVGRTHRQQPLPLEIFDRLALMFIYTVGSITAYNALPRGINKPVAVVIFGAGLWHAGGCSCKCLYKVAQRFFGALSHGGGSHSTHTSTTDGCWSTSTYYGDGGGYTSPSHTDSGGGDNNGGYSRIHTPPSSDSSIGGGWGSVGGSSCSNYSGGGRGSFSPSRDGTPTNSTMVYRDAPVKKQKK